MILDPAISDEEAARLRDAIKQKEAADEPR